MQITERSLLDGYHDIAKGGAYLSAISGEEVAWQYRTGRTSDGYNCTVASRDRAGEITLEHDRHGTINLDDNCADHPTLQLITRHQQELWGDQVPE